MQFIMGTVKIKSTIYRFYNIKIPTERKMDFLLNRELLIEALMRDAKSQAGIFEDLWVWKQGCVFYQKHF